MRDDMKDLIIKGHSRPKDRSNSRKYKVRDLEDAPERSRMREEHGWRDGPLDNLNPLIKYLKANIGRPWSKVYAEICAVADSRSFEGRHLREHIDGYVFSEEELVARMSHRWGFRGWRDFYYDSKGILRQNDFKPYKRHREDYNPDICYISNRPYTRINGCWFEGEYFTIPTEALEWQYIPSERKRQLLPKQYIRGLKQLNKKELRALGLSNEPGWKWYDQSK